MAAKISLRQHILLRFCSPSLSLSAMSNRSTSWLGQWLVSKPKNPQVNEVYMKYSFPNEQKLLGAAFESFLPLSKRNFLTCLLSETFRSHSPYILLLLQTLVHAAQAMAGRTNMDFVLVRSKIDAPISWGGLCPKGMGSTAKDCSKAIIAPKGWQEVGDWLNVSERLFIPIIEKGNSGSQYSFKTEMLPYPVPTKEEIHLPAPFLGPYNHLQWELWNQGLVILLTEIRCPVLELVEQRLSLLKAFHLPTSTLSTDGTWFIGRSQMGISQP